MDSNHRFPGVGRESSPLDHGTGRVEGRETRVESQSRGSLLLQALVSRLSALDRYWTHRELHPDRRFAGPASCCWTMSPFVVRAVARRLSSAEAVGLEPTNGCQPPPVFETGPSSGRMTSKSREARDKSREPEKRRTSLCSCLSTLHSRLICGGRTRTCGLVIQSHGFLPAETTPHCKVPCGS